MVLAETNDLSCMFRLTVEPAKAGDREGMVLKAPRMHKHYHRLLRHADFVLGLYYTYTALAADAIGSYSAAVQTVDGWTVHRLRAELHDRTTWDRTDSCDGCNDRGVASAGRLDVVLHGLAGISDGRFLGTDADEGWLEERLIFIDELMIESCYGGVVCNGSVVSLSIWGRRVSGCTP